MSTGGELRPPRFEAPIDLETHLARLPPDATARGLYFLDTIKRLTRSSGAGRASTVPTELGPILARRYQPFATYPYRDFMRLQHYAAQRLYPDEPIGEGLRRLGAGAYDALLASQVGRVIFGVFGRNFSLVVRMGAKGWGSSLNFGRVDFEDHGPGHARYVFTDMPAFLETMQVGVVEGGMRACGVEGRVLVAMRGLENATFDVTWND